MSNRIEITDFTAPELDVYARIPEVQLLRFYEPKPGLFIAEKPKGNPTRGQCRISAGFFFSSTQGSGKRRKRIVTKVPGNSGLYSRL